MMKFRHRFKAALLAMWAVSLMISEADAAAFATPGNLAVYRVPAVGANNGQDQSAVFIDEYTPAGVFVQSIALPTASSGSSAALIAQDDADVEGLLNRSTNGQYLVLTGYNHNLNDPVPGGTILSQSDASLVPRTIGRIGVDGVPDTTTTYNDSGTGSPRSVISDNGFNFWISQGSVGGDATPDGGVRFTTFGATGASSVVSTDSTDTRHIDIFGGELYVSSATSGLNGVLHVDRDTGTMTGLNAIPGGITAAGSNTVQFFLADLSAEVAGVDTAYVASTRAQADGGGLHKYSLVDGTWVDSGGMFGAPSGGPARSVLRGLTGVVDELTGTVTLYGTRNATTNDGQLLKFVDTTGYNGTMSGEASLLVQVTDSYFKGVDFVPVAATTAPGDHNGDGVVDAADYVVWRKTNIGGLQGYTDWVENFGATNGGGGGHDAVTGVPEPGLMSLAAIAALIVLSFVRCRRQPQYARVICRH